MVPSDESRRVADEPASGVPRVLAVADQRGRALLSAVIADAGATLIDGPPASRFEMLERTLAADAIYLHFGSDAASPDDALLDRIACEAARVPTVVEVPRSLLDPAAQLLAAPRVTLLCEPAPIDRVAALAVALARPGPLLRDNTADAGSARLRQLSEEVGRIARTLASLSAANPSRTPLAAVPNAHADAGTIDAAQIRGIIRARRMRAHYFDADLFADPAWDMLLDLMAARLEGAGVAVSSLCIAAAVPPTTALRWMKALTDAGLLLRHADPHDRRRVFIELTDGAAARMAAYLAAIDRLGIAAG